MSDCRDVNRDMQRVASLYNGVILEQLLSMHWEYLVDSSMPEEGKLRLDCQTCHRPVEEQPLFGPEVRENVKRTAVSVNSCITAIDYNTAWLAFCVKGNDMKLLSTFITLAKEFRLDIRDHRSNLLQPKAHSQSRAVVYRRANAHEDRLRTHRPQAHS